jgi:hypothetical protein
MPMPLAFYLWQLPHWTYVLAEFCVFVSQILIPFFVFGNKRAREIAFAAFLLTSVLIILSGNYGYFNILSIVVSISLLDEGRFSFRGESISQCRDNPMAKEYFIFGLRYSSLDAVYLYNCFAGP